MGVGDDELFGQSIAVALYCRSLGYSGVQRHFGPAGGGFRLGTVDTGLPPDS